MQMMFTEQYARARARGSNRRQVDKMTTWQSLRKVTFQHGTRARGDDDKVTVRAESIDGKR